MTGRRAPDGSGAVPPNVVPDGGTTTDAPADGEDERENESSSDGDSSKRVRSLPNGESLIVDFVANFVAGGDDVSFDLVEGRVLMSTGRLILATTTTKTVVPLTSVFDVAVGQVPPEVDEFFDHTVMVGYIVDGDRRTTVIGGDRDTIEKFSLILFRAILSNSKTLVKHPARIGGRVRDVPYVTTGLSLDRDTVSFPGGESVNAGDEPFAIDLASVVFFEVTDRTIDGEDESRLVLSVQHVADGQTVTTEVSLASRRKMNILGRYLRLRYHAIKSAVRSVELDEETMEVLVGLYSTGGEVDLAGLLDIEAAELETRLDALEDEGLIDEAAQTCSLTPEGRFFVNEEIEDVNV